jgi:4-hydroxybenzoate polyprenyltransferase
MVEQVDSTSTQSAMPVHPPSLRTLQQRVRHFLELIRFSHTVFALPFALLATVWSLHVPRQDGPLTAGTVALRVVGVVLCMVFARSAAMAFNRLADADIDGHNPRTAGRHLPAGLLSKRQVLVFFGVSCAGFVAACATFLPNWLPLAGALPVLVWICGYSLAKRFTAAAHLWLGGALALSPICAWLAVRGEVVLATPSDLLPAVGLGLAIAFWVAGFDIIYACQDADFDRQAGLRSIPSVLGVAGALRLAMFLHGIMLAILFALPPLFPQLSLGWLTYAALLVVTGLVVQQHWLVRPDDLARVNIAFFNINAVISFLFSLLAGIDPFLPAA